LRDLLAEHPGRASLVFALRLDGETGVRIVPERRFRVDYSPELVGAIEALVGPGSVVPVAG
jgi:hypothetical protein